jgi:hypothetical protein
MSSLNILAFGDIMGKPGREALKVKLPELKKKYQADLVIANVENFSHGYGVTEKTLVEMQTAGIDFFTSGNHIFKRPNDLDRLFNKFPLIRPANFGKKEIGEGYKIIEVGVYKILIINLIGQTFFEDKYDNPFTAFDKILAETKNEKPSIIIVDFHAEATSEKKSLGFYADGRAGLFFGTHTHVPTADEDILPNGCGYITDLGMCGIKNSSLGLDFENIIKAFVTETKQPRILREHGLCTINGIFAKINIANGKTIKIQRLREEIEI